MENDEMSDADQTFKVIRFHKRLSIGLMVFFTVIAAVNCALFFNNLDPPNWIMLIICGFFCCLFVRNTFKCFRNYQTFSAHYTILKTQGLVALQEHILREERGKDNDPSQK